VPGPLIAEIGSEALQDALTLGWLRPDMETGFLCLTDQQTQLQAMRELADAKEAAPEPKQESSSRAFAMNHSTRFHEAFGVGLTSGSSMSAPGSGQSREVEPMSPQTPTSMPNKPNSDYMVGEDVVVADEGKSYQAKVQQKNPDGTYRLSFGPNRPTQQDRMFRREEMQKIQASGQQANLIKVEQ
jgi:hypothetical protein